jgi:ribose-phosphate pyrophosphokinase
MTTINTITGEGVKFTLFPDNQPHVNVGNLPEGEHVRLVCPIRSSLELIQLLEISNALDRRFAVKKQLVIPYLMGARSDREMVIGDSVDLQVVSELINSCNFEQVNLFDVHSDVATLLIKRCKNHNNSKLVKAYEVPNSVLICPDAGAMKKVSKYLEWNSNISDVIYCQKIRDPADGKITLRVENPKSIQGRPVVVIDDLCDGGATFTAIAAQTLYDSSHRTLIVSHGIFSKGLAQLGTWFNQIITSDSYQKHEPHPQLRIIPLNL